MNFKPTKKGPREGGRDGRSSGWEEEEEKDCVQCIRATKFKCATF